MRVKIVRIKWRNNRLIVWSLIAVLLLTQSDAECRVVKGGNPGITSMETKNRVGYR